MSFAFNLPAERIGQYEFNCFKPGHWQVKRGDFIMAVVGSRREAEAYIQRNHDAETVQ